MDKNGLIYTDAFCSPVSVIQMFFIIHDNYSASSVSVFLLSHCEPALLLPPLLHTDGRQPQEWVSEYLP